MAYTIRGSPRSPRLRRSRREGRSCLSASADDSEAERAVASRRPPGPTPAGGKTTQWPITPETEETNLSLIKNPRQAYLYKGNIQWRKQENRRIKGLSGLRPWRGLMPLPSPSSAEPTAFPASAEKDCRL